MYNTPILEFLNMGGGEMMLIIVAILLLFGGKKLPELARGLGKGMREFKDASEGVKREIHRNINSFEMKEEDRRHMEDYTYKEPEEDYNHSIHDEDKIVEHNENETPIDSVHTPTTEENEEPKRSV